MNIKIHERSEWYRFTRPEVERGKVYVVNKMYSHVCDLQQCNHIY